MNRKHFVIATDCGNPKYRFENCSQLPYLAGNSCLGLTQMGRKRGSVINKRTASVELLAEIGERLRWVREAHESLEPLQHSQAQWAAALGVSASSLSRWESGKQLPILQVLHDHVYLSGVDFNYLFFGVLSSRMMPTIRDVLAKAHPELQPEAAFFRVRDRIAQRGTLRQATPRQRRARRSRIQSQSSNDKA
jgi:transcriptional regulator with XRE-family HTH domain